MKEDLKRLVDILCEHQFVARYFETSQEAKQAVLKQIPTGASVGIGGSATVYQIGLVEDLEDKDCKIYSNWAAPAEDSARNLAAAQSADVYLLSCNAIVKDGRLVNTDGMGNRVSASIFGVPKVIYIVGRNKLVENLDEAFRRIQEVAAPQNAKRLGLKTPCAITGVCTDCNTPHRMCRVTTIHERPTRNTQTHVYLVDEDLGF
ncbi:MAG: lactate utilization protein [Christensenellales bacterium]|jgi:hypothetical protein